MYSVGTNEKNTKKQKGIRKSQVKNTKSEDFYNCLLRGEHQ